MATAIAHGVEGAREVGLDTPVAEVCAGLLDALDLALDAPAVAFLGEAAADDTDHGIVQTGVERAALRKVLLVAVLQSPVRVEVAAQLEQQVKGIARAAGQTGQACDVGKELEHACAEGWGGKRVVQVVLQAVQVKVDNGDLAVKLSVQRCGSVGWRVGVRRLVHLVGNACGDVYAIVSMSANGGNTKPLGCAYQA
jgi:hypothetical protein